MRANFIFHLMSDAVGIFHRHLRVNFKMHIHEKLITHLAHETFFHAVHAGNRPCHGTDLLDEFAVGRAIHQFIERRTQQPPAVPGDDGGGAEGE